MTSTPTQSDLKRLAGLSLGEAFVQHVMRDGVVADIASQILPLRPDYGPVFSEGRLPGPIDDKFYWDLNLKVDKLAHEFGRVITIGPPNGKIHEASELETAAAAAIIEAIKTLQQALAAGELVALGTYVGTGAEVAIGLGQWKRKDLQIDVKNSAVCEGMTRKPPALWTGVRIEAPIKRFAKTHKQVQSKQTAVEKCEALFLRMMSDPDFEPITKDDLWEQAKAKWPEKISRRQVMKCRENVLEDISIEQRALWERSGPRRKRL